ncbi:putative mannose-binding endoplasmic reticulum-Golgi intermediate compartment lectin [Monocercomonoides exilis]|uniref:putative mannose-binding endoplasmic reticulum-Golgi intermediate compartment lectin n=1 Tax=Monocercomonoides exilis TaxID=2049356 RepID=UPI00355A9381|nr:putative mannose-binding endoplasmic reticulum-Golgi intermediate compartment lectin [Monocercomonoides exilis]|eukprot:MONOS_2922.1-p1 / transcript=MONOS_2922.1 / gene=MONOS_2922 / organism=Monocercomonoides_exilis_PA203 / gene_product=Lectin ERGIC-53 / transcript_product=Lectin ERGIC-53 / location=Mono_scaffold00064:14126-16201(-) / protein_length=556 / sequence_SO=supercontig / SO=protein_coding / is_pseudo=false
MLFLYLIALSKLINSDSSNPFFAKPPFLMNLDDGLDGWSYDGQTIVTEKMIRLTPPEKDSKGNMWSHYQNHFPEWEANFEISIGGGSRGGADGLAFWYVEKPRAIGDIYGNEDKWKGLAVIFDTYDNDRKGNNPYILAILNDGTMQYDHAHDGITQQIGGTQTDFRISSPENDQPVHIRVVYENNALWVQTSSRIRGFHSEADDLIKPYSRIEGQEDYIVLPDGRELSTVMLVPDVDLPLNYYFGFSAATGNYFDYHGIRSVDIAPPKHHIPSTAVMRQWLAQREAEKAQKTQHEASSEQVGVQRVIDTQDNEVMLQQLAHALQQLEAQADALTAKINAIPTISTSPASSAQQAPPSDAVKVQDFQRIQTEVQTMMDQLKEDLDKKIFVSLNAEINKAVKAAGEELKKKIVIDLPKQQPSNIVPSESLLTDSYISNLTSAINKITNDAMDKILQNVKTVANTRMDMTVNRFNERLSMKIMNLRRTALLDVATSSKDFQQYTKEAISQAKKLERMNKRNKRITTVLVLIGSQSLLAYAIVYSRKKKEEFKHFQKWI